MKWKRENYLRMTVEEAEDHSTMLARGTSTEEERSNITHWMFKIRANTLKAGLRLMHGT
jgi:hypothetical protein